MPDTETYTPAQLADETQILAENYLGAVSEIEDTREGIARVQETVDEINAKIVTPTYQNKTVTPSDVQQIVQADNGYNALWSVTVEPIAAAMPENLEAFIMNQSTAPFSISIDGNVPNYACYGRNKLKRIYGNPASIGENAFRNCIGLENVDAENLINIGNGAFQDCHSLKSIYAPKLQNLNGASYHFRYCTALKKVIMSGMTSFNGGNCFQNDTNLEYVDMRRVNAILYSSIFDSCVSLILIDFTLVEDTPILSNVNNFSNTNSTWIAVVANDTMKAVFQSATNWSTYASHIKTVAEVEAEVGMSYDDYYLQCFGHPRFDN